MTSRRTRTVALAGPSLGAASIAFAQADPAPVITPTMQTREVTLLIGVDDPPGNIGINKQEDATGSGAFVESLFDTATGSTGAGALGAAFQDSQISTFAIEGEGFVEVEAQGGPGFDAGFVQAVSLISIDFTVPVDADFAFSGTFSAENSNDGFCVARYSLTGTRPDGTMLFYLDDADAEVDTEPLVFFITDSIKAGTQFTLSVNLTGTASAFASEVVGALGSFEFEFNLGDEDKDGLLDDWEKNGIDVDGDDIPDLNLPLMGANYRKKDLFVELDAMAGFPVDVPAIERVIAAFAAAPADMVDNPDGSAGVTLHVIVDETNLPAISSTALSALDTLKPAFFGTPTERAQTDIWDDLREAKLRVFRYCLWADDCISNGKNISGYAELPGNDFLVAAGTVSGWSSSFTPNTSLALSGTFMHELGHTLGLRHGAVDNILYKPNYFSVMNYTFQCPWTGIESAWKLDYAREVGSPLDESALEETLGVDGPGDRTMVFNSAPDGMTPVRTMVAADSAQVDWNQMNGIELMTVQRDINRFRLSVTASPGQTLEAATDWDRLYYHLGGDSQFDDGVARDPARLPVEFTEDDILEFNSTAVIDLTSCPGDANGDEVVNFGDITEVLNNWLADYSPATGPGDGNGDGVVDFGDITSALENWLGTCP